MAFAPSSKGRYKSGGFFFQKASIQNSQSLIIQSFYIAIKFDRNQTLNNQITSSQEMAAIQVFVQFTLHLLFQLLALQHDQDTVSTATPAHFECIGAIGISQFFAELDTALTETGDGLMVAEGKMFYVTDGVISISADNRRYFAINNSTLDLEIVESAEEASTFTIKTNSLYHSQGLFNIQYTTPQEEQAESGDAVAQASTPLDLKIILENTESVCQRAPFTLRAVDSSLADPKAYEIVGISGNLGA